MHSVEVEAKKELVSVWNRRAEPEPPRVPEMGARARSVFRRAMAEIADDGNEESGPMLILFMVFGWIEGNQMNVDLRDGLAVVGWLSACDAAGCTAGQVADALRAAGREHNER